MQSRSEAVTVQVVEKHELKTAEKALSGPDPDAFRHEIDALNSKLDRVVAVLQNLFSSIDTKTGAMLQALSGLRIELDGAAVGQLVTPEVNVRLNDLYDLEERGRF